MFANIKSGTETSFDITGTRSMELKKQGRCDREKEPGN